MSIRVSIIIPIFNAASTLQAAVDSLLRQDLAEVETVERCVSTDETPELCHRLASRDSRIQVVTQKNAGICAARNRGLSVARGEYIAFCDDDDEFLPGALRLLYETAEREQADIVRGKLSVVPGTAGRQFPRSTTMLRDGTCRMWEAGYAAFLQNSGPQFVWNALYKRSALQNRKFDERCRYGLEDFVFNAVLYAGTDRVVYLPDAVYCHYERAQSTSICQSSRALQGRIAALDLWMGAEYAAVQSRCSEKESRRLWPLRKAEAITFLMHQLRDARAPAALRRYAWKTLRGVLAAYPSRTLDFWQGTGQNKKKTAALLLYQLRMQRLYDLLTGEQRGK